MTQQPVKSGKKVSRRVIVFAIIVLSPVILLGILWIKTQLEYLPIRAEVTRIADSSGVKPISVGCASGLDIGVVCRALYNALTNEEHTRMFTDNGYTIDVTTDDGSGYVSATNSKVHIDAAGSPGYEGSGYEGKTSITYQLNNFQN
jgi:hypothetical protein